MLTSCFLNGLDMLDCAYLDIWLERARHTLGLLVERERNAPELCRSVDQNHRYGRNIRPKNGRMGLVATHPTIGLLLLVFTLGVKVVTSFGTIERKGRYRLTQWVRYI